MIKQGPKVYSHRATGTKTQLSDFLGTDYEPGRLYKAFVLRIKDETDATTIFFVGDEDVSVSSKNGISGGGDAGIYGPVIETLNVPVQQGFGIDLSLYWVAHSANTDFVLIVY